MADVFSDMVKDLFAAFAEDPISCLLILLVVMCIVFLNRRAF